MHGAEEMRGAAAAGQVLFGQGELTDVPLDSLSAALLETPNVTLEATELEDGELPAVDELMVRCGLVESKGAARRLFFQFDELGLEFISGFGAKLFSFNSCHACVSP